ncbi:ROK family protein [candidate division WWE3 bacterium]|jgi:glucokinase|uniref:ROK family protein n=1 Tax=candidate division WWE3 bacterium TaxID=2053526 RepID=A0A3A4ZCZ0_UNCKA|nr:MAG: ROK family protein [candidate division WWE3 bacterium]
MFISIDLGGTNTRIASSDNCTDIAKIEVFKSIHNVPEQREKIVKTTEALLQGEVLEGLCIGIPGMINRSSKTIVKASNYPELNNVSVYDLIGIQVGENFFLENDAALGGLGETLRGAGRGNQAVAYITLGTGVGGSLIENGKISDARSLSEPGHMIINFDAEVKDTLSYKGSLEAYVSGKSFMSQYNIKPEDCDDLEIWEKYSGHLVFGVLNVIAMWGPDKIVIGGGLSNKFNYFISGLQDKLKKYGSFEFPEIVKSELGDSSGIVGGFEFLAQHLV